MPKWESDRGVSHIYVIGASEHRKIGFTAAVETRVAHLQTAHWEILTMEFFEAQPSYRHAQLVERYAQALLAEHHVRGEWFKVSKDVAIAAVRDAMESVTNGKTLHFEARATVGPLRRVPAQRVKLTVDGR